MCKFEIQVLTCLYSNISIFISGLCLVSQITRPALLKKCTFAHAVHCYPYCNAARHRGANSPITPPSLVSASPLPKAKTHPHRSHWRQMTWDRRAEVKDRGLEGRPGERDKSGAEVMGHCCSRTARTHELALDEHGCRWRYVALPTHAAR
jgi:hypothetical protein